MRCEWCGATEELRWEWGMRRDRTHGFRLVCITADWRCRRDGMRDSRIRAVRPIDNAWLHMDYDIHAIRSDKERD